MTRARPSPATTYACALDAAAVLLAAVLVVALPPPGGHDLLRAAACTLGALVCVEAPHRFRDAVPGNAVRREVLSAWLLPVALVTSPVLAMLAALPVFLLLSENGHRLPLWIRLTAGATNGLAGSLAALAGAAVAGRAPMEALPAGRGLAGVLAAVVVYGVLNALLPAVFVALAFPGRDRERWDPWTTVAEACVLAAAVLVAAALVVDPWLLAAALPALLLVQRGLVHADLLAAARTDAKTGLLNAGGWRVAAQGALTRARREGRPLTILLFDLDHFKRINDTHGHLTGDEVLVAVAAALRRTVRARDVVGRFGGEEFVLLLMQPVPVAAEVAERLRRAVAGVAVPADGDGDVTVTVTASAGVAGWTPGRRAGEAATGTPDDAAGDTTLDDLLRRADRLLYEAKAAGRDQVRVDPDDVRACADLPTPTPARRPAR